VLGWGFLLSYSNLQQTFVNAIHTLFLTARTPRALSNDAFPAQLYRMRWNVFFSITSADWLRSNFSSVTPITFLHIDDVQ
jgi:hypothetical protein